MWSCHGLTCDCCLNSQVPQPTIQVIIEVWMNVEIGRPMRAVGKLLHCLFAPVISPNWRNTSILNTGNRCRTTSIDTGVHNQVYIWAAKVSRIKRVTWPSELIQRALQWLCVWCAKSILVVCRFSPKPKSRRCGAYWGDPNTLSTRDVFPRLSNNNNNFKNRPWSFLIVGLFNAADSFYLRKKILSLNHTYLIAAIKGFLRAFICALNDH